MLLSLAPLSAKAAALSLSPTSGAFEIGDKITVKIIVSSSVSINAISGTVSFPTSIFTIESVSKSGSILNFWVSEPNFSQGAGTLQFEGVALGGFQGGTGAVITAVLRATKVGSGTISFKSGQVLANDGQGTDVTSDLGEATFSVEAKKETSKLPMPEEIKKPEMPEQQLTLLSPEISLTKKFGEQAIAGISSYPQTQVLLTFISENGIKIVITGITDNNGEFVLLVPQTLKRGSYKVSAIITQDNIARSYASNEITVKIGNIFSDISWWMWLIIILLIAALIYLIIRRFFVRREAKEAENAVHQSFKLLREETDGEIKKDMKEAEDLIAKEIKDIEEI